MKRTANAHANIAFIKYWGKKDDVLRLPCNDSLSMNISGAYTTTTVAFSSTLDKDDISFIGKETTSSEIDRIQKHLALIRQKAKKNIMAKVVTKNSFPKGIGAASSASGFAALTMAACAALSLKLSEKELSILARIGSGSACRSIPDGFVQWHAGETSSDSFAESVYPHTYWNIRDILVVVDSTMKKINSTDGMDDAPTSPLFLARIASVSRRLRLLKQALAKKDFALFGQVLEAESLTMHAVMFTQEPSLLYWQPQTVAVLRKVSQLRESGIPAFATIDAGPNVHVICQEADETTVLDALSEVPHEQLLVNLPAGGTRLTQEHLF